MASDLPLRASHTLAVLSSEVETIRWPSGLNCALVTVDSCPCRVTRRLPLWLSHTCALRSSEAVTMLWPSGLNCALSTALRCSQKAMGVAKLHVFNAPTAFSAAKVDVLS